jgi:anti-sigma factor RsiW
MTTDPETNPLIDEQLSAWLDDELPRVEVDLLITRLASSPDFQARLARYSLISSGLRGGPAGRGTGELAALRLAGRVRAALDESTGTPKQPLSLRPNRALPYAMAAGIALVAVLLTMVQGPLRRLIGTPVQVAAEPVIAAPVPASVRQASLSSQRLTNYLVQHGEYSGLLSARVTESHIINNRPHSAALQAADRSLAR